MKKKFFDSTIILRSVRTEMPKEDIYGAKGLMKIWDVDVNKIVISKLIETNNFQVFDWILRWIYKAISFEIT